MTLWINGDWVTGLGERRVKTNPVSGDVLWQGNDADAAQVAQACRAARAAFASWAKQPFGARQAIVEKFASLLESNKAELTQIIARETGKPRWEAATELTAMINKIAISVKAWHARTGEHHSELPDGAEDLQGQEVVFKTTVHEIREKVLPELNDDFAKELDREGVDTLEQLKESVKEELLTNKQAQAKEAAENKLIEEVINLAEVDIPQAMVDSEAQIILSEFQQQLAQQGLNFDLYKQILSQTDEDVMTQIAPDAQKRVLYRLVMEEVAKREGIEVSDEEIDAEYQSISDRFHVELEQVKAMAAKEDIAFDVKLKKAVDLLLSR